MKRMFKPACILFYVLTVLVFFVLGMIFGGISGAAENQGLAGAAIVIGYGAIFAFIALLISLIIAYRVEYRTVIRINWVFLSLLVLTILIIVLRHRGKKDNIKEIVEPTKQTTAYSFFINSASATEINKPDEPLGLGFFKPNFFDHLILYFYGKPNSEKTVTGHSAVDSVVFTQLENGGYDISYAPPWLVPAHLKLDYEILYFKVDSVADDFLEVVVNSVGHTTLYVDRQKGETIYWPDFLLKMNSIEFLSKSDSTVRLKPLLYASEISTSYQFMRAVFVRNEWMLIELLDNQFQKVGEGWIKWKDDKELLIKYSLLS